MKLSNISTGPYRPQIKRLSQKDLPLPQFNNDIDYPSTLSTKKWFNNRQNRVSPSLNNSWMYHNKPRKDPNNNNSKKKLTRQACFWIIIAIILLVIVGAIIGIIVGLTLPLSTNTQSSTAMSSSVSATNSASSTSVATTTTVSIICSNTGHGLIAFQNDSTPITWTLYSFSFSATKTASTLVFGFQTDGTNSFYLDIVSVVNTGTPLNQLLINPNFENSTTGPTGWITSCEMTLCGGSASRIETSNTQCSSGYCFESFCTAGRSALIFLSQTFVTTNGNSHSISFMLKRTNIPSSGFMAFYLDVV